MRKLVSIAQPRETSEIELLEKFNVFATEEEEEGKDEAEEQAGVLRGVLAFEIIHSDDLWRHILEFV